MNKKFKTTLIILFSICIIVLIILFMIKKAREPKYSYDISSFHEVSVNDVIKMFNDQKTHVVMVGYSKCETCAGIIPSMKEAQIENNFITQYLDIEKVDRKSKNWYTLADMLDMETEQYVTEDHSGDKITNTYGYFLHHYGLTPTIIIINTSINNRNIRLPNIALLVVLKSINPLNFT